MAWHLGLLCAALLLPVLALQGFLLFRVAAAEHDRAEERARDSAQRIAVSLDRDLATLGAVVEVLSSSDHLLRNDLEAFRLRIQQLPWMRGAGIVLRDREGFTLFAAGAVPPGPRGEAAEAAARASGRAQISGFLPGSPDAPPAFVIVVPVPGPEGFGRVLVLRVPLAALDELLAGRSVPDGMAAAIVDGAGRVLAGTAQDPWPVGSRPAPLAPPADPEGWMRSQDVSGEATAMAFARTEVAGWTAWVVMPEHRFMAPLRRSLAETLLVASVLVGLAATLALAFSRRLTRPISSLAQAVAAGQEVAAATPVREVNALAGAYAAARSEAQRLREAQAEMQRVARLNEMGVLAAELAHEVNQPLAAAANFAEAAIRLLPTGDVAPAVEAARQAMRDAADQAVRAGGILRRLRGFLAPSDNSWQEVDVNALVRDAASLAVPDARRQGIALRLDLAGDLPFVAMDRVQIGQVVVNLVRNAVEAMQDGGRREVTLTTKAAGQDCVAISVADTGPGLSPDVRDRIFDPFVTTKPDGMGVGLTICRDIVEEHGGGLEYAPNPDGGTVFLVHLPVRGKGADRHG